MPTVRGQPLLGYDVLENKLQSVSSGESKCRGFKGTNSRPSA